MQNFGFTVDVRWLENGASFEVTSIGQEEVPVKLEIIMRPGAWFITDGIEMRLRPGDYVYQRCGTAEIITPDRRRIAINGGFCTHRFGENMRGTLNVDAERAFIAMTDQTPIRHTVKIAMI